MLLQVGNSWARLLEATSTEEAFVRDFLTLTLTGFKGRPREESLLTRDRYFPAGLARRVIRAIRTKGFDVQVVPRQDRLHLDPGTVVGDWTARTHQVSALDAIRTHRRGLIQHATGAGKSDLIGLLASKIQGRVLIIGTSEVLQADLWKRCQKFGVAAGRLGGGYKPKDERVVVSVFNSLKNAPRRLLESFQAVLGDEVHSAGGPTYGNAVMACVNASLRVGFSATALDRADKKSLYVVGAFGETLHRYSPQEAARDGVIALARVRMVPFRHAAHQDQLYSDWEGVAIARNRERNRMILRLATEAPGPRIVFTRTKEHQAELLKMFGTLYAAIVNEDSTKAEIESVLKRLRDGSLPTLISTPIFRQGVDVPELQTVVQASGGKAVIDVIQKVGRGSRRHQKDGSTKDSFLVIDIDDHGCGCGFERQKGSYLHRGCEWLERHSDERRAAYEKFGYHVFAE